MNSQPKNSPDWPLFFAVAISILAWSSAWVGIRAAVPFYGPGPLAAGRYLVASLVLLPLFLVRRPKLPAPREWPAIGVMGLLGFTFYNLCINAGEQTVTAGAAAFLASTIPIFTTLGAQIFLKERASKASWVGFALSLAGVAIIAWGEEGGLHFSPGALLIVLAALCAAGYGLLQKVFVRRYGALDITTWAIWAGTLGLLPFMAKLPAAFQNAPLGATLWLLFLGVFPGAIGYVLWSYCLAKMPVARLMSFLYLVPPISVVLAFFALGEIPSSLSLIGGGLALGGVILSNLLGRATRQ